MTDRCGLLRLDPLESPEEHRKRCRERREDLTELLEAMLDRQVPKILEEAISEVVSEAYQVGMGGCSTFCKMRYTRSREVSKPPYPCAGMTYRLDGRGYRSFQQRGKIDEFGGAHTDTPFFLQAERRQTWMRETGQRR